MRSYLSAQLWTDDVGDPEPVMSLDGAVSNIRILWEIPGGVQAVELDYATTQLSAYDFYKRYLGYRLIISDQYCDRPVAEGWLYGVAIAPFGNSLLCRGPWFRHFDRYDTHSAKMTQTTTEILKDSLSNYVPILSDDFAHIAETGFAIDPNPGLGPEVVANPGFETTGASTNKLSNGTLESLGTDNTFEYWTDHAGTGAITDETTIVYQGNHAVKLVSGENGDTYIYQRVRVLPHQRFELSLYNRGDGSSYPGRWRVRDVTHDADIIAPQSGTTGTSYVEYNDDFEIPAGCGQLEIRLYCPAADVSYPHTTYFDSIELQALDLTFARWYERVGDGTIEEENTIVHSGTNAVKLTAGSSTGTWISQPIYVVEGEKMQLAFYSAGDGTYAGRYQVRDATHDTDIVAIKSTGITANSYSEVTETFTIPTGCTYIKIIFACPGTDGGIAYFDDASLRNTTVYWRLSDTGIYPGDLIRKLSVMSNNNLAQWNYWVESQVFDGVTPRKPIAHFQPQVNDGTFDWQIWKRDLARDSLTMERSIEDLANKVLVIYRDVAGNERSLTEWATDSDSVNKFWTREVIKSGGEMVPDAARQYRELYLSKYAEPMLKRSFTIGAPRIMDAGGSRWPLWRVIAEGGGYLRFNDLYPASELVYQSWDRARIGQIMTAEYDDQQATLRIVLDTEDERLDRMLARLGAYA
jgi:hypothetical protein